jgi:predicted naringenin-chalcone synthase
MARYAADAGPLAIRSAHRALTGSGVSTGEVTHLITVSCTGFAAPGVDLEMIECLGLGTGVARTHVGFMGCHGAMNGLRMARAVVEADPGALVLVTAVELCSLHQQYGWDRERVVANALFADGAASVVVGAARSRDPIALVSMAGSTRFEDSRAMMGWKVGDHGFTMNLSAGVPDAIRTNLRAWVESWLGSTGLRIGDIGGWAIHPGGPRILTAARESLGLDEEAMVESRVVLSEFGNMSSPTVLFILERFIRESKPGPWVLLGFGPGLAAEAAIVTIGE